MRAFDMHLIKGNLLTYYFLVPPWLVVCGLYLESLLIRSGPLCSTPRPLALVLGPRQYETHRVMSINQIFMQPIQALQLAGDETVAWLDTLGILKKDWFLVFHVSCE